jgi:hypothetical protein
VTLNGRAFIGRRLNNSSLKRVAHPAALRAYGAAEPYAKLRSVWNVEGGWSRPIWLALAAIIVNPVAVRALTVRAVAILTFAVKALTPGSLLFCQRRGFGDNFSIARYDGVAGASIVAVRIS